MAFNDTLFQLGMDLTRSSTTQKEDLVRTESVNGEVRKDHFVEANGAKFAGKHLIIDLFGARRLDDLHHVEATIKRCVEAAGATLLHSHVHRLGSNGGLAGVAVLAESHISMHSWPEAGYAAFDVFMCGDANPEACVEVLRDAFGAGEVVVKTHRRGEEIDRSAWRRAAARRKSGSRRARMPHTGEQALRIA
jgi:S-adenosylmethionine decarboxylase